MNRKKEAGQALIAAITALGIVLMGFAGLGIDMGYMRYEKRLQQTAADAAAIAGANNIANGGVGAGAKAASAANGFTDGANGVTITVNGLGSGYGSPATGPHFNDKNYVEVLVAAVQPTFFMRALGINSEIVTARAVATNLSGANSGGGCLYTLGAPSAAIEGLNIQGNATLNATTCGIVDNGNFDPSGNALNINAGTFGVSGTDTGGGGGAITCTAQTTCPSYGSPAGANPLASLTPPPVGTAATFNQANPVPGTYNGISISGNGTVNFAPGIYVVTQSNFGCSGTPTITGTGVMFYFTNGATFNCQGNDTVNFVAPSPTNCPVCAAQYDGILFYQDPNDTNGPSVGGNTGTTYDGVMYFPKAQLTFYGNNGSIDVAIVVADSLDFHGNPTVNLQGAAGLPTGVNIVSTTVLVE